jgi:phosphate transport system substrate-binding protein
VKAGTVDFGASDAALSDATMKDLPRRSCTSPRWAARRAGGHLPGFEGRLQLTPDVLSAIYLGSITTWSDKRLAVVIPAWRCRQRPSWPCIARTAAAPRTSSRSTCPR